MLGLGYVTWAALVRFRGECTDANGRCKLDPPKTKKKKKKNWMENTLEIVHARTQVLAGTVLSDLTHAS